MNDDGIDIMQEDLQGTSGQTKKKLQAMALTMITTDTLMMCMAGILSGGKMEE